MQSIQKGSKKMTRLHEIMTTPENLIPGDMVARTRLRVFEEPLKVLSITNDPKSDYVQIHLSDNEGNEVTVEERKIGYIVKLGLA